METVTAAVVICPKQIFFIDGLFVVANGRSYVVFCSGGSLVTGLLTANISRICCNDITSRGVNFYIDTVDIEKRRDEKTNMVNKRR